ncbi:50S ribosomal protein L17 [Candidatus Woesebacteria bacterium RIFOXYC1_FULL_41_14]|uniref:50S ribosomal protein L17 n=3 Tax=Candidatus Woeseibacteriota TaxID=1752722 RepID=A0A0G0WZB0_9BACT|nr:MAG: 50S ribosomal protein L17 [Candidatus Woesebacteria bacterium GW2011_GWD1_41_12]KKS18134.1 MAG: 50S ribosomal protein L17 [Candidatus Woesebacteria bacterium GW2011_GWA1_41_7]OGM83591.1 MAG: 50S ribosomal protein L17 [Candidatus Woesebacteria bacterium RIFOXYC1_FULL_41_14]OGM87557.1 MAG: 50S ribosomal protein L17 [Candidatus Woesebacteria bacterium RIFOXYD1_FULL_41_28]
MNKKVFGRKLSRSRPAREALFTSLAKALIKNGKIVTTRAKAKAVIPNVEKMITLAKKESLAGRRRVLGILDNSKEETSILFGSVVKAFSGKTSGFTRIVSLPRRLGDNAETVRLEWTEKVEYETKAKEEKKAKKVETKEVKKEVKKVEKKSVKKEVKSKK